MKDKLKKYMSQLEEILVLFDAEEKSAIDKLMTFKETLEKVDSDSESPFGVCIYNVLATINSVPCQTQKSSQLIGAILEAKEEMSAIYEII